MNHEPEWMQFDDLHKPRVIDMRRAALDAIKWMAWTGVMTIVALLMNEVILAVYDKAAV